eukprot:TRINITY_DN946_c0_g1_i1.p1 TRINITY_DN946_c0_g1~~TRINITY_DN946_c0_g1_i1.p1  ORF type:complete len:296 (-),score=65.21 TRINITY_DN946_c0_g1_i1:93-980(-)
MLVAYINWVELMVSMKGIDEAIIRFKKAIELCPDHLESRIKLTVCLVHVNKVPEALELSTESIDLDPDCAMLYDAKGLSLLYSNDYWKALDVLKEAVKLDPKYLMAHWNLAYAYMGLEQYSNAILSLDTALLIHGAEPDICLPRGACASILELGNEETYDWVADLLKIDPEHPRKNYYAGVYHLHNKDYPAALDSFLSAETGEEGVRYNGDDLYALRGDSYLGTSQYKEAITNYELVLATNADDLYSMKGLALAYEKMGDAEKSKSWSEKANSTVHRVGALSNHIDYLRPKELFA